MTALRWFKLLSYVTITNSIANGNVLGRNSKCDNYLTKWWVDLSSNSRMMVDLFKIRKSRQAPSSWHSSRLSSWADNFQKETRWNFTYSDIFVNLDTRYVCCLVLSVSTCYFSESLIRKLMSNRLIKVSLIFCELG